MPQTICQLWQWFSRRSIVATACSSRTLCSRGGGGFRVNPQQTFCTPYYPTPPSAQPSCPFCAHQRLSLQLSYEKRMPHINRLFDHHWHLTRVIKTTGIIPYRLLFDLHLFFISPLGHPPPPWAPPAWVELFQSFAQSSKGFCSCSQPAEPPCARGKHVMSSYFGFKCWSSKFTPTLWNHDSVLTIGNCISAGWLIQHHHQQFSRITMSAIIKIAQRIIQSIIRCNFWAVNRILRFRQTLIARTKL